MEIGSQGSENHPIHAEGLPREAEAGLCQQDQQQWPGLALSQASGQHLLQPHCLQGTNGIWRMDREEGAETPIWMFFLPDLSFQCISRQQKQDRATWASHRRSGVGKGGAVRKDFPEKWAGQLPSHSSHLKYTDCL